MVDAPVLGTGAFGVRVRVSSRPFLNFLREVFLYEDIELSFCFKQVLFKLVVIPNLVRNLILKFFEKMLKQVQHDDKSCVYPHLSS